MCRFLAKISFSQLFGLWFYMINVFGQLFLLDFSDHYFYILKPFIFGSYFFLSSFWLFWFYAFGFYFSFTWAFIFRIFQWTHFRLFILILHFNSLPSLLVLFCTLPCIVIFYLFVNTFINVLMNLFSLYNVLCLHGYSLFPSMVNTALVGDWICTGGWDEKKNR